jgi:hypothetical protein
LQFQFAAICFDLELAFAHLVLFQKATKLFLYPACVFSTCVRGGTRTFSSRHRRASYPSANHQSPFRSPWPDSFVGVLVPPRFDLIFPVIKLRFKNPTAAP